MSHSGHPDCIYPSKAACERARHEKLGRCTEMTHDRKTPTACAKWAEEVIDGRAVCTQHATVLAARVDAERRASAKRAELNARIDAYIAWSATHPHVWDSMR